MIKASHRAAKPTHRTIKTDFDVFLKLNDTGKIHTRGTSFKEQSDIWRNVYRNAVKEFSNNCFQPLPEITECEITDFIIDSLHFPQIRDRKRQIEARPAYPTTFSWMFDGHWEGQSPGSGFAKWMEQRGSSSLYWVAGCPGSGKSTLMHFLSEACQTRDSLALWKGNRSLVIASCFFWLSGSPIQKSLTGLLRSLLHDLFIQVPRLVQQSIAWRWRAYRSGATSLPEWTTTELIDTLRRLTEAVAGTKNCMFLLIDGLDEFDGSDAERVELVEYLKVLGTSPCVKLCVSSRPWPVFESAFGSGPKLRLEKLTQGDISLYVNEKFEKLRAFQDFTLLYPSACQALTEGIVVKARGVFLWVYLVVASLSRGMEDGLNMKQLQEKLAEMPGDLETYFRRIILAVPKRYRPVAAAYLALLLDINHRITLLSLSFFDIEDAKSTHEYSQSAILEANKRTTARRIESHCGGLLQVYERPECGIYRNQYVDFLHRTVQDFLHLKDIQVILQANLQPALAPLSVVSRSVLTQLETINPGHPDLEGLARDFLRYASDIESRSQCADVHLIDRFFSQVHGHLLQNDEARQKYGSLGSILTAAIHWKLATFAKAKIDTATTDLNGTYYALFCEEEVVLGPLLRHCFPSFDPSVDDPYDLVAEDLMPQEMVVAALFAKGADPNQMINGRTVWEEFLEQAQHIRHGLARTDNVKTLEHSSWVRTARLFIDNGASAVWRHPRSLPPRTERSSWTGTPSYSNAVHLCDAVESIFGSEDGPTLAKALRDRSSVQR